MTQWRNSNGVNFSLGYAIRPLVEYNDAPGPIIGYGERSA